MTVSKLEKLFNVSSSLDIGVDEKKKISEVIANLPQGQKENIQSLWNGFLVNRENLHELKEAIRNLSPIRKVPPEILGLILEFEGGNLSVACVNKGFQSETKRCHEETLKTYLADPKIAPYVPKTNESATVRVRKTVETIKALATPILDELPHEIRQLSPLDLRPWIEAIEDRDCITVFETIREQIPAAPPLNLESPKARATAIRDWMNDPTNQPLLHSITTLILSDLKLTVLPPEIGQLTALEGLSLSNNQLKTLPPEIGQLVALQRLHLENNQLKVLPPEIGQLAALISLNLNNNQLEALPPEIGQLTALISLNLNNNQLKALPPEIGALTALQWLNLEHNQLKVLPPEIGALTVLQWLFLSNNRLKILSPEIGQLTALQILHLKNNQLEALPPGVERNGLYITLRGNPIFQRPIDNTTHRICRVATSIIMAIAAGSILFYTVRK